MEYKIYSFNTLSSTNDKAKEMASYEEEGTVIIAEEQTKGRGRLGRNWISSKGKDILLSIILKPNFKPVQLQMIVPVAAAAVNMALRDIGIESQIKWPNDIVIDGKKVCGILMELCSSGDSMNHVVLGIGINVNQDHKDIPEDLKDKSTSLKLVLNREVNQEELIEYVLNRFREYYITYRDKMNIEDTINICRENSSVIGKEVLVIQGKKKPRKGLAIDINMSGELMVQFPEGLENVNYGEISIRGMDRYI